MLESIITTCQDLLYSFPEAENIRKYIENRISNSAIKEFQLGYYPNKSNLSLFTNMFSDQDLIKTGLFYYRIIEGEKTLSSTLENHNIVMPYKDAYGKVIAIVGRTIFSDDEKKENNISKYKNSSFKKANHLFGLWRAKSSIIKNNCVFVVEGQFDCINAISNGIENCVCLGSGSMTFNQFSILSRYTNNIIMLLDNDEAGNIGSKKAISNFNDRSEVNIFEARLPDGYKDLDQFICDEKTYAVNYVNSLIVNRK